MLITALMFYRSASCFFELEWKGAKVTLKASNGKYLAAKKNGQLAASVDSAGVCVQEKRQQRLISFPRPFRNKGEKSFRRFIMTGNQLSGKV